MFSISVVTEMTGLGAHTLRGYERAGLLRPARTAGGMRLYSPPACLWDSRCRLGVGASCLRLSRRGASASGGAALSGRRGAGPGNARLLRAPWSDPADLDLDLDHIVPLVEAWRCGEPSGDQPLAVVRLRLERNRTKYEWAGTSSRRRGPRCRPW
ncbi:MerR family DNA-binding transcriptional regulator [Plantactinospora sp. BB1]|uniref:MerR family DNA-binding transcriptional regulator n=1 Tax=Plantactinospora sp. BB1 TaxID=2071627 RepID=UPI0035123C45